MRSVFGASAAFAAFAGARRFLINPLLVMLIGVALTFAARAQNAQSPAPVSADVAAYADQGYGRLLITFSQEIKARVRVENGILIVDFGRPVRFSADKLASRLQGYVTAVRRDPDGTALRLALNGRPTVNVMEAAEKLFVDLLPENWVGLPPGLPTAVVDELARRAREAEHKAKMDRFGPQKVYQPVKLRYASAPTFSRFSFEMAEPMPVVNEQDGQEVRIIFGVPVKVDFGEVFAALPPGVVGLDADYQYDRTIVRLVLAPDAGMRAFQENAAFVVDVMQDKAQAPKDIQGLLKELDNAGEQLTETKPETKSETKPAAKQELAAVTPQEAKEAKEEAKPLAPAVPVVMPETQAEASAPPAVVPAAPAPRAGGEPPVKSVAQQPAKPAGDAVFASVTRQPNGVSIELPFNEAVSGAMFRRGDWTFVVLDTARPIRLGDLVNDSAQNVKGVEQSALPSGQLIKLRIEASRLASLAVGDKGWTLQIGGSLLSPTRPIPARRVFVGQGRAGVFIPLVAPVHAYNIKDDEIGDDLVVVTAASPVRGLVRGQDFVDFNALASVHGVALAPKADDLSVELSMEGLTITRPRGLEVSEMSSVLPALPEKTRGAENASAALDPDVWQEERAADFEEREMNLARALAEAPVVARAEKRLTLARFYLARGLASNALGTLDAAAESEAKYGSDASRALLHGYAQLSLGRAREAFRDFNQPVLAKSPQAAVLRASALSDLGRYPEARDQFNSGKQAVATLPVDVQRHVLLDALRTMVNTSDFGAATDIRGEIDVVGTPPEMKAPLGVLSAQLAAGLGRRDQAIDLYAEIAAGPAGPAMAEARLKLVEMRLQNGDFDRQRAIEGLETLSFVWRGDETEVQAMQLLARLYVAESRYRDAFNLLDGAMLVRPESNTTRGFYNEMAAIFEDLFLSDRAKSIDPLEALALYYDFSKLTPIGRRGDELIRRLADRLVSVDLLDQAADLLDYQVKYRLTGVAKAQVAAKLAWVQLLNHQPAPAIQALAATRVADLPGELRDQRLMLEARALSELGRYDAALELAGGLPGKEADRLRGDILWAAKRWREAGEAYEKLLGARWQTPKPLDDMERADVLRAGIAFTLGNETIGLARLRDRYAAKMPESAERTAFGIMAAAGNDPKKMTDVSKVLSTVDSLRLFLKLYQARYPDSPLPETAEPKPQKVSAR
jgi:tetratricopeptide (TPR) repeat protein